MQTPGSILTDSGLSLILKRMKWASAVTMARSAPEAVNELEKAIRARLDQIDLAFLFVSPYFKDDYDRLPKRVCEQLDCSVLLGCSARGVIGGGREVERQPAISLLAASLPDVTLKPFHRDHSDLPDLDASAKKWEDCFGLSEDSSSYMVLLVDPLTLDVEMALQGLDYAYPHAIKVGGLTSGMEGTGQSGLFLNRKRFRSGLIGVGLSGKIAMETVVAHGCRPVGRPFSVTRCDRNLLLEMDHQKSMDVLKDLFLELSETDQQHIQHSMFIGFSNTPFHEYLKQSEVLIRPVVGFDFKTGALAVGAVPREGQSGQFYVRDKETSTEELQWSLGTYQLEKEQALGALLFACTGRGTHFYGKPDRDTEIFHSMIGRVPLGGSFCGGEIGTVNKTTLLHSYTSCFGLFRKPS